MTVWLSLLIHFQDEGVMPTSCAMKRVIFDTSFPDNVNHCASGYKCACGDEERPLTVGNLLHVVAGQHVTQGVEVSHHLAQSNLHSQRRRGGGIWG